MRGDVVFIDPSALTKEAGKGSEISPEFYRIKAIALFLILACQRTKTVSIAAFKKTAPKRLTPPLKDIPTMKTDNRKNRPKLPRQKSSLQKMNTT